MTGFSESESKPPQAREHRRFERLLELPPSAKLVFRVLHYEADQPLVAADISERTLLPRRTTRYALTTLETADIVESRPNPHDVRQQLYTTRPIDTDSTEPK